jgi:hypothetical protein
LSLAANEQEMAASWLSMRPKTGWHRVAERDAGERQRELFFLN